MNIRADKRHRQMTLVTVHLSNSTMKIAINKSTTLFKLMEKLAINMHTNVLFVGTPDDDSDEPLDLRQSVENIMTSDLIVNLTVIPILDVSKFSFDLNSQSCEMIHTT